MEFMVLCPVKHGHGLGTFIDVRIVAKSADYFHHVRPSVSVSADPARRILVKFDIGDMKSTYPTKSAYNRTKTRDTSHAGLRAFYCYRRQNFDIQAFLSSTQYF